MICAFFFCFLQEKAAPSFVGFANLPNQVFRKSVKRGFQFTLMVVGECGWEGGGRGRGEEGGERGSGSKWAGLMCGG